MREYRLIGKKHIIKHHEDYEEHKLILTYEINIHTSVDIEEVFDKTEDFQNSNQI